MSSSDEEDEDMPKIVLPQRATRGKRMQNLLDDGDSADEEFWNQEFFAEEGADDEYKTESSSEDEADTDFSEVEDEGDDEDGDEREERTRRKVVRPPGHKKPPTGKPTAPASKRPAGPTGTSPPGGPPQPRVPRLPEAKAEYVERPLEAPTLRTSTRQRIEDAEKERQTVEQNKPKRKRVEAELRILTQEELLAEAAQTEIVNQKELASMVAQEEEVRKRNEVIKAQHMGPLLRYHSRATPNGQALTTFGAVNADSLPLFEPQYAPPTVDRSLCVITGQPAKYRDPLTGAAYATVAAFKELRQRHLEGRPLSSKRAPKRRAGF